MKCPVCNGQKHYKNVFGKDIACQYCLGTGEVEEKKRTNFQRISASPEALAEFIENHCNCINCPTECPATEACNDYKSCYRAMVEWLKQESE